MRQAAVMDRPVLELRPGDKFLWADPLSAEVQTLTVTGGPVNHFGSVTLQVEEWDFEFEATVTTVVETISPQIVNTPGR